MSAHGVCSGKELLHRFRPRSVATSKSFGSCPSDHVAHTPPGEIRDVTCLAQSFEDAPGCGFHGRNLAHCHSLIVKGEARPALESRQSASRVRTRLSSAGEDVSSSRNFRSRSGCALLSSRCLGSAGCQPAGLGSLLSPRCNDLFRDYVCKECCRQAAGNCRLAACAPQKKKSRRKVVHERVVPRGFCIRRGRVGCIGLKVRCRRRRRFTLRFLPERMNDKTDYRDADQESATLKAGHGWANGMCKSKSRKSMT